jgi:hypothetical protein
VKSSLILTAGFQAEGYTLYIYGITGPQMGTLEISVDGSVASIVDLKVNRFAIAFLSGSTRAHAPYTIDTIYRLSGSLIHRKKSEGL